MENLGYLALVLAFTLSLYSIAAAVAGRWKRKPLLELSAQRAVAAVWLLLTGACVLVSYLIFTDDFRLSFVWQVSNTDLPGLYKMAALWGGQEGSLLFWSWIASTYVFVAVYTNRRRHADMISYALAVMMGVLAFFLLLITFVANPFKVIMTAGSITAPPEGNGLNPLLQHPLMAIHPPMLYLGYVGFMVPFAFAISSLITRQPGDRWIHTTRIWTMITWLFLSIGVVLGARWAYAVLGWGGYWGWDPVENASLLPWITGTAFLHSVMMQEKKGMMKVWNIVLISATFFLCILGTMMTRSGLVSSVHAFAQSNIGDYFVWFMTLSIPATILLILNRLDYLKSENQLESVVSRESSFLFNNVVLLASCFAVLWGTLFPVITEAFTGSKISVGPPFYNKINIPIALFLLFLTGVGPLFAWRRTSVDSLKKNFFWPAVASLALGAGLVALGIRDIYALMCFMLCLFVAVTIFVEFYKGALLIQKKQEMSLAGAAVELTHRNTRRYGGYIVHMAMVFMFIGFAGSAFNKEGIFEVAPGDSFELAGHQFRLADISEEETPNYQGAAAQVELLSGGEVYDTMAPERRFYPIAEQMVGEVAIRPRLDKDIYLVYAGMSNDGQKPIIQVFINPLVNWVWVGGFLLVFGTLVALVPSKIKMAYAQTKVVGSAKKETVEASGVRR